MQAGIVAETLIPVRRKAVSRAIVTLRREPNTDGLRSSKGTFLAGEYYLLDQVHEALGADGVKEHFEHIGDGPAPLGELTNVSELSTACRLLRGWIGGTDAMRLEWRQRAGGWAIGDEELIGRMAR
jgi:hypothetical protein